MKLSVGDTVRYRGEFMRSIAAYTGPLGILDAQVEHRRRAGQGERQQPGEMWAQHPHFH
jgi:hypothetical protein